MSYDTNHIPPPGNGPDDVPTSPRYGQMPSMPDPWNRSGATTGPSETLYSTGAPPPPPQTSGRMPAAPAGGAPRGRGPRLSRRGLMVGAVAVGVTAAAITTGIIYARENGGLHNPFAAKPAPAGNQQIAHLLRRAGFGALPSEIQSYAALGYQGAVDQLLNYNNVPDDLETRLSKIAFDFTKVQDMQRWWVLRMIYSKRPFQEKMTLFWHGLLTSSYTKVGGKEGYPYLIQQNKFLRDHALDTYDNILLGITSDPAMMWWLDLRLSQKNAPNENFARELMELFTLGVNGGYTQADVHDAARALTGWTLPRGATQGVYRAAQHDDTTKTLLGHTGNLTTQDVIRIVAGHPATGPYLCKRIFEFFVHENPSQADIQPMVDAYNNQGHSISAVMRAMFNSPTFLAAEAYRSRIKSPTEFVIGTIRQLEIESDGQSIAAAIAQMGQTLFNPPNVAGWPGDVSSAQWINTGTWLTRVNLINLIAAATATQRNGQGQLQSLITKRGLHSADDILQNFATNLVDNQLTDDQRQSLQQYLAANVKGPTLNLAGGGTIPETNVTGALYLLMASPEYQLN